MNSFQPVSFRKCRTAFMGGLALLTLTLAPAQIATSEYFFTHLAGPVEGNADGIGSAAHFNKPKGTAVDSSGNIYVADTDHHTIRKITPAGVVTTLAGLADNSGNTDGAGSAARFNYPSGVAVDNTGNLYVADEGNHTIRKISPTGVVTTLAGSPGVSISGWSSSGDGIGSAARFMFPKSVAVDSAGTLYVSNTNAIRKISPTGVVTTLAGLYGSSGSDDGTGLAARFDLPDGVAVDSAGYVYVADTHNNTLRKISPTGEVTTLAGVSPSTAGRDSSGSIDGTGSAARFAGPSGVTVDSAGTIYVTEMGNTLRKISPLGVVTTLAGLPLPYSTGESVDGTGSTARFNQPSGLAVDGTGNLYVADSGNKTIRKVTAAGTVTTLAGSPNDNHHVPGNADGVAAAARFDNPTGVAADSAGNVYCADQYNHTIRKISPAGLVTTLAGLSGSGGNADGAGSAARFMHPHGVAVDSSGTVFVADMGNGTIRKISPVGVVTTLAGQLSSPMGVAVDRAGYVYVAAGGDNTIRKISASGEVATLAGAPPSSVSLDSWGSRDGTGSAARFYDPYGVAVDSAGSLYVTDTGNNTLRKISPSGVVTTLAGSAGLGASVDGTGSVARFFWPMGVAVDSTGYIFVTDAGSNTVRKISPTGVVTTLASRPGYYYGGSADGVGSTAQFNGPRGVAADSAGILYVADTYTNAIRKGQLAGPPVITTQPLGQTAATGATVQFSVTAGAVPAPTYQWYFNGSAFSGATTNTLSFTNARSTDAGDYTVTVTNELGSVTSAKATLTISSAPVAAASTQAAASGGGGSIEGWFTLAVMILGMIRAVSLRVARR